jgi:hypothetical protein
MWARQRTKLDNNKTADKELELLRNWLQKIINKYFPEDQKFSVDKLDIETLVMLTDLFSWRINVDEFNSRKNDKIKKTESVFIANQAYIELLWETMDLAKWNKGELTDLEMEISTNNLYTA